MICTAETADDTITQRRLDAVGKKHTTFKTNDGRVLGNAVILKVTDAGISMRHDSGTTRLRYADLNIEQREFFGLKAESATETYRREQQQQAAYEQKVEKKLAVAAARHAKLAEQQRIADEKNQEAIVASFTEQAAGTIPEQPTVSKVISSPGFRYGRSYVSPYTYSGYYGYPAYRSGHTYGNYYRPRNHYQPGRNVRASYSRGNFQFNLNYRR